MAPTLVGVSIIAFLLIHWMPGDPAEILAEETVESVFSVRLERLTGEDGSSVLVFHRRDGGV